MQFKSNIDEVIRDLERKKRNIEEISGSHKIPYDDLFTSEFMQENTKFKSIHEMIQSSGFPIKSSEDIEKIPDDEWSGFIQKNTSFPNWKEMIETAGMEYFTKKTKHALEK
jgi:hypothetical protein